MRGLCDKVDDNRIICIILYTRGDFIQSLISKHNEKHEELKKMFPSYCYTLLFFLSYVSVSFVFIQNKCIMFND